jgi:hypothetical protein
MDVITCWVTTAGVPTCLDAFSSLELMPIVDPISNVEVVRGSEEDGVTTVTFMRPLRSPEELWDVSITDVDLLVSWSIGDTDDVSITHDPSEGIGWGSFRANLVSGGAIAMLDVGFLAAHPSGIPLESPGHLLLFVTVLLLASFAVLRHAQLMQKCIRARVQWYAVSTREISKSRKTLVTTQPPSRLHSNSPDRGAVDVMRQSGDELESTLPSDLGLASVVLSIAPEQSGNTATIIPYWLPALDAKIVRRPLRVVRKLLDKRVPLPLK